MMTDELLTFAQNLVVQQIRLAAMLVSFDLMLEPVAKLVGWKLPERNDRYSFYFGLWSLSFWLHV